MRFRWQGTEHAAEFIRKLPSGDIIARALGHGPRFAPGTEVQIQPHEIVECAELDAPPATATPATEPVVDPKAMQAAMDAEREKLPPLKEIIANPNFTQPRSASSPAAASQTGDAMSDDFSRLQEKAKFAAGAAGEVAKAVEKTFDDVLARKAALLERNASIAAKQDAIFTQAHGGLDIVENALNLLSNGGPA